MYREMHLVSRRQENVFQFVQKCGIADDYCGRKAYPYISLYHETFANMVRRFLRPGMRVIDVGCGAGDKLLAFKKLCKGLHITGLEYNPTTAAVARYMAPFANVIEGNAFSHDFYDYDLIYMYRPIPDEFLQGELQRHVMFTMRPGATLHVKFQACTDFIQPTAVFPNLEMGWRKP